MGCSTQRLIPFVCIAAFVSGCASVSSVSSINSKSRGIGHKPDDGGLVYYLPMRYVEAVFRREEVDVEALTKAQTAAATAHRAAQAALGPAESAAKQAKARAEALLKSGMAATSEKYHDALLVEIDTALAYANAVAAAARTEKAHDEATKALMSAKAAEAQCGYVDTFSFAPQKLVADINAKYILRMEHSWFRNDEWSFKTTTQGLLSTVDSVNDDQSAQILVALAQARATGSAPRNASITQFKESRDIAENFTLAEKPRSICDYDWKPQTVRMLINPMDKKSLALFIDDVNKAARVQCKADSDCGSIEIQYEMDTSPNAPSPFVETSDNGSNGVFYRRELPVNLSIFRRDNIENLHRFGGSDAEAALLNELNKTKFALESKRSAPAADDDNAFKEATERYNYLQMEWMKGLTTLGEKQTVATFQLMLPNASPAEHLPLKAGSFVKTHHALEFDQGMLTSVKSERPSEALRIASTPWEIAKATMGVLGEIVKFKVDYTTQDAALIEQQTALLEQLRLQLEAQRELDAARGNDDP